MNHGNSHRADLWLLILLVEEHRNRFNSLIKRLKQIGKDSHYEYDNSKALVSHARNLEKMIAENNIDVESLLVHDDPTFMKKQKIKAKNRIIKMKFKEEDKSQWMIETPEYLYRKDALRKNWDRFPINPLEYSLMIDTSFKKKTGYSESQTLALTDRLLRKINTLTKATSNNKAIAIYRAALTILLEHMDSIDDSFGQYGMLYGDLFMRYLSIERAQLPSKELFLLDLLPLIIVGDYGFLDTILKKCFNKFPSDELCIAENILIDEAAKLKQLDLEYYREEALKILKIIQKIK